MRAALAVVLTLLALAPAAAAPPARLLPAIVDEIQRSMVRIEGSRICARVVGKTAQRVNVYTEAVRDVPAQTAQASAVANAGVARDVLERHKLAIPAYVEVSSPTRWYGVAVYDSKTQRVLWFRCAKNCEQLGTRRIRRCR